MLEVKNLSKFYSKHVALDDVSLTVPKGSIYGLLGPNGAGKTSLIRIITQITAPDKGEVVLNSQLLNSSHISKMGYLPEERGLYKKMKVEEQLFYLGRLKGLSSSEVKKRVNKWMEKLDMLSWKKKNIADLSKGMQQKVQFIATILHQPDLIILDEPFTGFDPVNTEIIKNEILSLRDNGATILLSTHRMESVETLCDHFTLINNSKKVIDGRKEDIKNQFKKDIFQIISSDEIKELPKVFELIESKKIENAYRTRVKILESSSNALLSHLLPKTIIISFKEDIPSIHDIFIELVQQNKS